MATLRGRIWTAIIKSAAKAYGTSGQHTSARKKYFKKHIYFHDRVLIELRVMVTTNKKKKPSICKCQNTETRKKVRLQWYLLFAMAKKICWFYHAFVKGDTFQYRSFQICLKILAQLSNYLQHSVLRN
jgi:hypothetical protein